MRLLSLAGNVSSVFVNNLFCNSNENVKKKVKFIRYIFPSNVSSLAGVSGFSVTF